MRGISVILPVFNGAAMLERCISSVFGAGKRVEEVIVVDDGSTDDTYITAERIRKKDSRIRMIRTENHGSYMARINGIRAAVSPYIAFIDVDDLFCEGGLDLLVELLEQYDADVAMGGFIHTSCAVMDRKGHEKIRGEVRLQTKEEMWPRIMKWKTQEFICYLWNKVYKKELFSDITEVEGLCQGDDVLMTCQIFLKVRRVVETTEPVYLYYQNPQSLTRAAFGDKDLDLIRVWDCIEELMRGKGGKLRAMARYNRWRTDFTLICRLILADDRILDKKYAGELEKWRNGLKRHWFLLVSTRALPMNRALLIVGLRFAFLPVKMAMRLGKRLVGN